MHEYCNILINILLIGDDMKKLEATYNQAQRIWVDNMIAACRVSG